MKPQIVVVQKRKPVLLVLGLLNMLIGLFLVEEFRQIDLSLRRFKPSNAEF